MEVSGQLHAQVAALPLQGEKLSLNKNKAYVSE
jgi:hypothetical protein